MSFSRAIRNGTRQIKRADEVSDIVSSIRTAAQQPTYPSVLGMIFNNADMTLNTRTNRLDINGVALNKVEPLLRAGDLRGFVRAINDTTVISNTTQNAFRRSLIDIPDVEVRRLNDTIAQNRIGHPDLDINVNNISTGDELRNTMTPQARSKFENAMNKIKAAAGTTLVASGVFALIYLGVDFYQAIIDATNNRRGCFLVRSVNNRVQTCRLTGRTCLDPREPNCEITPVPQLGFNTTIFLINGLLDPTLGAQIQDILEIQTYDEDVLQQILTDSALFGKVEEYYNANSESIGINNPCATISSINGGNVTLCRACDSQANPTEATFFDASGLPDNFSLVCVPTGSILETIVDIGFGIGVDLLSPFGKLSGSISNNVGWILLFIVVFIIIIIIFGFIFKK